MDCAITADTLFPARILLGLPPSVLVGSPQAKQPAAPDCTEFFWLVNSELVGAGKQPWVAGTGGDLVLGRFANVAAVTWSQLLQCVQPMWDCCGQEWGYHSGSRDNWG